MGLSRQKSVLALCIVAILGVAAVYAKSFVVSANEFVIYPKLRAVISRYDPEATRILLLGGSVLESSAPSIRGSDGGRPVKVYNLAQSSHTSLDSRYKYEYLVAQGYAFDYVVFYHAINDVRANNIPPELYQEDYGHYSFYKLAKKVFKEDTSLAYLVRATRPGFLLYKKWIDLTQKERMIYQGGPKFRDKVEWLAYGKDIKSEKDFRKNLLAITELAKKQHAKLIVPQFAFNLPADYSLEKFNNRTLGYAYRYIDCCAAELWGVPENVVKGIEAHNNVIFAERQNYVYLPTDGISAEITNFTDICHFSEKGNEKFAALVNAQLR